MTKTMDLAYEGKRFRLEAINDGDYPGFWVYAETMEAFDAFYPQSLWPDNTTIEQIPSPYVGVVEGGAWERVRVRMASSMVSAGVSQALTRMKT